MMTSEIYGFWERLYSLAKEKKITIKKACEDTGISYHALTSAKCEGREYPALNTIIKLAEVYSVSLDYLILGKDNCNNASLTADEELLLKEYNSLDLNHKNKVYASVLTAKHDMFTESLKKENSISGSKVG